MITPIMIKSFRKDFADAVKELENKYGVSVNMGSVTYNNVSFTSKIEVRVVGEDAEQTDKKEFERYAKIFGFEPTDYNREFALQGKRFRLVGFNPRCRVNPCSIKDVSNGEKYKCSEKAIKFD